LPPVTAAALSSPLPIAAIKTASDAPRKDRAIRRFLENTSLHRHEASL